MENKILLVDDETNIVNLLAEVLHGEGFSCVEKADTGSAAVAKCRTFQPDVIVLDIMLPDMDGIEVCKQIRTFSHCSILFLSAKSDDMDKILGLAAGGDDYVAKPFSPKEIVYRIKAQLRRQQYTQSDKPQAGSVMIRVGELMLDADACAAYCRDRLLPLTAKEYGLLQYLMENPNKIISKERLYEQVWGEMSAVCDNTIMVHIRHLREKIEADASNPKILTTVKGLGYKLTDGGKA